MINKDAYTSVTDAVNYEFQEIKDKYPFHNGHEALAVLMEEIEETSECIDSIKMKFEFIKDIVFKDGDIVTLRCSIIDLERKALATILEAVQVHAVANKWLHYMETADSEEGLRCNGIYRD